MLAAPVAPSSAQTTVLNSTPVADTYVRQDSSSRNFGTGSTIQSDGSPVKRGLLRFSLSGIPVGASVRSAVLSGTVVDGSSDGPAVYEIGSLWSETTVTWSSQPARTTGIALADVGNVPGPKVSWNVTTLFASGDPNRMVSLQLAQPGANGLDLASRETPNDPLLAVTYTTSAPAPDTSPPDTTITSAPPATTTATDATFAFTSTEPGTFHCSLDGGAWESCASPRTYSGLTVGQHAFQARAVDQAGNVDGSPASHSWTIEAPPTPACSDGLDNDQDGSTDLADPGCSDPQDNDESNVLPPPPPPPAGGVVVAGAGDVADSDFDAEKTAKLLDAINPATVFTTGDNAYPNATLADYNAYYDPTWGRHKAKTRPSPGNHEYITAGAPGYFDYFNGPGVTSGPAGTRGQGYYAYDIAPGWRAYALNSNISRGSTSAQVQWLRQDLTANPRPCVLAYSHHPRFTAGNYSDFTSEQSIWQALYDSNAELVLNSHDHNYQRYTPLRPDGVPDASRGIREFVVGMGGKNHYTLSPRTDGKREAANDTAFGVLKLTLRPDGYDWQFVPEAGATYGDSGSSSCH
jgi:Calcineurin-like phosphoesterase